MDTGPCGMGALMGFSKMAPYELGDSIVEWYDLKKWEEEEEDNITSKKFLRADQDSPPKGWTIPHYDIDSLRKSSELFDGMEVVLYEKLHGSNAGFCHDGEKLWVKSRNFYKKMNEDDMWWDIAIRYDLEKKLAQYPNKVFFGEIYGQVKGFRYDCELINGEMPPKIRFFDIWDTKSMRWLNDDELVKIVTEAGLDMVPELYRGPWQGKEAMYKFAEGLTTLGGKHIREGYVIRPATEARDAHFNRLIRKLVGEGYNLQK
jgi:RNA ligase (TIGR02306 family)